MAEVKSFADLPDIDTSHVEPETSRPADVEGATKQNVDAIDAAWDAAEKGFSGDEESGQTQTEETTPDETPAPEAQSTDKPKAAPTAEAKAKAKPEGEQASDAARAAADSDDELDAIPKPRGMHPKNAEGWEKLKGKVVEYKGKFKEADAKVTDLQRQLDEAKSAPPALPPDKEAYYKELEESDFRNRAENSLRIRQKYDEPMGKKRETVLALLESLNVLPKTVAEAEAQKDAEGQTPASVEYLKKLKGLGEEAFANGATGAYQFWEQFLNAPNVDGRTKAKLRAALDGYFDDLEAKGNELKELPKTRDAYEAEQKRRGEKQQVEYFNTLVAAAGEYQKANDWVLEKPIPADAKPEQRRALEDANKFVRESLHAAFKTGVDAAHSGDPKQIALLATGEKSPKAIYLQAQLEQRDKALAAAEKRASDAEAELSKIKNAGKITQARNTSVTAPKKGVPTFEESWDATIGAN